jgi:hypothetical protein
MLERILEWAEIIGPNKYLQAITTAIVFIAIGIVASWLLRGIVGRLTNRSETDLDDRLVDLLHKPVFLTFVLIGMAVATRELELGDSPQFVTLGLLRTIAIVIWYSTLHQMTTTLVQSAKRLSSSNKTPSKYFCLRCLYILFSWPGILMSRRGWHPPVLSVSR